MNSKLLRSLSKQDSIEKAWRVIQDNARGSASAEVRREVEEFSQETGSRIRSICHRLSRRSFKFGPARGILAAKKDSKGQKTGKERPIVLAPLEARIVQRSVLNALHSVQGLERFIKTPYSFGGVRREKPTEGRSKRDDPSAVPAAIKAVLNAIAEGAGFFSCADIRSFFTRVSKPHVLDLVSTADDDQEFMEFFRKAIASELSNLDELKGRAAVFPTEEIGVAQGNSLSPVLGNIALAKFDLEMNQGDCSCIRYIDDFIVLGPSMKAVNARMRKAVRLLRELGMDLASEKSAGAAESVEKGCEFLGIELLPGIIRPSAKARDRFLSAIKDELSKTQAAFRSFRAGKPLARSRSLVSTLRRVEGMVDGWGKHYWFCNDLVAFSHIDVQISRAIKQFLGAYRDLRSSLDSNRANDMLGIPRLADQQRRPFPYPRQES